MIELFSYRTVLWRQSDPFWNRWFCASPFSQRHALSSRIFRGGFLLDVRPIPKRYRCGALTKEFCALGVVKSEGTEIGSVDETLKRLKTSYTTKTEKNFWWKGLTKTTFCILLSLNTRHLLLKRRVLDEIGQSGYVSIFLAGGGTAFCTWLLHRHPYFRDRRQGWRSVRWCHLFPWWWNFRGWWIETRDLFNQGEHCSITWNPKFVVTKLDIKHVEGCQHLGSRWEFKFELIFNQRNPKKPSPNPLWTGV